MARAKAKPRGVPAESKKATYLVSGGDRGIDFGHGVRGRTYAEALKALEEELKDDGLLDDKIDLDVYEVIYKGKITVEMKTVMSVTGDL